MRSKFGVTAAAALTALVFAVTSSAALPFWWWTPAKASQAVVVKNFQFWPGRDGAAPHSTITRSACKGTGLAKRSGRTRYYRHFICAVAWKYDEPDPTYGSGPFKSYLLCDTTKAKPLGVRCNVSA